MNWPWRRGGGGASPPAGRASGAGGNLGPDQVVALLRSPDPEHRRTALAALDAIAKGALPEGAPGTFLRGATLEFPDVKPTFRPAAAELVKVLERHAAEIDPQLVVGGLWRTRC